MHVYIYIYMHQKIYVCTHLYILSPHFYSLIPNPHDLKPERSQVMLMEPFLKAGEESLEAVSAHLHPRP
jgi:hypothetical protein